MIVHYPNLKACTLILFPLIREQMAVNEPAPYYEYEQRGTDRLASTFTLMENDRYYGSVLAKAAYLFCSVIDGHPFSNGNKRLAVALLTYFLIVNVYRVHAPNMQAIRKELKRQFPRLTWETIHAFKHPHEYFFYHLALIIADRAQKGKMTFTEEQGAVVELLKFVTIK